MARNWTPSKSWDGRLQVSAFLDVAQIAGRLFQEAVGEPRSYHVARVTRPPSDIRTGDFAEFRSDLNDVDEDRLERLYINIVPATGAHSPLEVTITTRDGLNNDRVTDLDVSGENRTATEGVFAQLRDEITEYLERPKREAERAEEQGTDLPARQPGADERPLWRNPWAWVIGIATSIVGGGLLALVIALAS